MYARVGNFHDFFVGSNWDYRIFGVGNLYLYRAKLFEMGDLVAFDDTDSLSARNAIVLKKIRLITKADLLYS